MTDPSRNGFIRRSWHFLWSPHPRWTLLGILVVGLVAGVALSGFSAGALYFTSTDTFCTSCHANNVVPEWKQSKHYVNTAGFRVTCAECHEPHDPVGFVMRKIAGMNEVWNHVLGTISTPAKFEAHRLELAQHEWARLRANNSQECRNCHHVDEMSDPAKAFLPNMHRSALANGQTCIDCHKGVAHKAPTAPAAAGGKG